MSQDRLIIFFHFIPQLTESPLVAAFDVRQFESHSDSLLWLKQKELHSTARGLGDQRMPNFSQLCLYLERILAAHAQQDLLPRRQTFQLKICELVQHSRLIE